jgi:3-(3-hydroxy-phenyl)propionate hydroxylase
MAKSDPVIIVGAGPAGLTTALSLALQKVPVIVLESEPKLPRDLRAGSFHPPTLEMFEPLGVADEFIGMGIKVPHWQVRDQTEIVVEWDLGMLADQTRYPFRLHCEQYKLAPLLNRRLQEVGGGEVRFANKFVGVEQDADGVTATVETPSGLAQIRGRYLVGADGGRSTVRRCMEVQFEGFTWPERFLIISTPYDLAPHGYTENVYISDPIDWVVIVKMPHNGPPGLWRVTFATDMNTSDDVILSSENVERLLQKFLAKPEPYPVEYASVYGINQRVASKFRIGRLLLVGDAAHLNSPVGAFGLNGSVHAAVNLAEKLGHVWLGDAPEDLLDLYVRQRRQANIEFVQAQSIRNKRMLDERDPTVRARNFDELRRIASDPAAAKDYLMRTSMIASVRRAATIQ